MNERPKNTYTGLGLIMGTAIGFALGLITYVSTGEPLFLLIGTVGTAIGLLFGASVDRANRQS